MADLSFISLTKVLPAVARAAAPRFDLLAMVKPQFEVGRERVGKGGVVRSAGRPARGAGRRWPSSRAPSWGCPCSATRRPGCPGPAGNRETFVWLAEPGRAGAVEDLEAAARRAEPS